MLKISVSLVILRSTEPPAQLSHTTRHYFSVVSLLCDIPRASRGQGQTCGQEARVQRLWPVSEVSSHWESANPAHAGSKHLQWILTPVTELAASSLPIAEIEQSLRITATAESSRKVIEICWVFKLYEHISFHLIFKIQQILTECHRRPWIMLGASV